MCGRTGCEYAGFELDGETIVALPGGGEVTFPGCPAKYADADVQMWLAWYRWLTTWSKTPADLGVPVARIDPRYFEAMELIEDVRGDYIREHARK